MITKYTIRRPSEECGCTECGWPLYVGDRALLVNDAPFCSKRCARVATARLEEVSR